ncbi:MAG: pectate lyase [Actinobacteria bacterium]|nr:pectate lyase [Actinomycetota bacterium]
MHKLWLKSSVMALSLVAILSACDSGAPIPETGAETDPESLMARSSTVATRGPKRQSFSSTITPAGRSSSSGSATLKAFPTAEGFGRKAVGGRMGRVIQVTNLRNAGVGSLRAALSASYPRIVVFRVGGTIEIQSELEIESPYVTIAGQTAPGDGITIKASPSFTDAALEIEAHDVVIRHLRVRAGPSSERSSMRRGISIEEDARRVILDHVSVSWATDDNITIIDGARRVTVQWSIISEALSHSTHIEGEHSMGLAMSGKSFTTRERVRKISVHHSLLAHNRQRNPRVNTAGTVDFTNNVIYNWGISAARAVDDFVTVPFNLVGNYFKSGPDSRGYEITVDAETGKGAALFIRDNIGPHRPSDADPDQSVVEIEDRRWVVGDRNPASPITETDPRTAYDEVLQGAGVTVPRRDVVDERVVADVRMGTGRIIDDPMEVGGWPVLFSGVPYPDEDEDGMDDRWEEAHGLDPTKASDKNQVSPSGYTWVEEFLNELAGD